MAHSISIPSVTIHIMRAVSMMANVCYNLCYVECYLCTVMLSVIMLNVIKLIFIVPSVIKLSGMLKGAKLSVILQNIIKLSVVIL